MIVSEAPLLLSVKPCYSDLIFKGLKRAELRRRSPTQMKGRDIFLYVTSPVMELSGGFRVGQVWAGTPEEIWSAVSSKAGLDKSDFDAYFAGQSTAFALEITKVWQYAKPVGLRFLRSWFDNFVVPQSWRYVKPEEHQCFESMQRGERLQDNTRLSTTAFSRGSTTAATAIRPNI